MPTKTGLWANKVVKTKLPIRYNRRYKLSKAQRDELIKLAGEGCSKKWLATKFGVVRTTVYLILNKEYRERTYKNTKRHYTKEYMLKKKYESQQYKKDILEKIEKGVING